MRRSTHDEPIDAGIPTNEPLDQVKAFNAANPVGTRVRYWRGFRSGEPSGQGKTRSAAWVMCGTPVVLIEGTSGAIALTHVEKIEEVAP